MKPTVSAATHDFPFRGLQMGVGRSGSQGAAGRSLMSQVLSVRQLLVSIALLGQRFGFDDEVQEIRGLLLGLGIDGGKFDIARAMTLLEIGHARKCMNLLESEVLATAPSHELANAVCVLALKAIDDCSWRARANSLLSMAVDPLARSLVQQCLVAAN
jgi:hypothetical protein